MILRRRRKLLKRFDKIAREVTERLAKPAETKAGQYAELEKRLRRQDRSIGQRIDWEKE